MARVPPALVVLGSAVVPMLSVKGTYRLLKRPHVPRFGRIPDLKTSRSAPTTKSLRTTLLSQSATSMFNPIKHSYLCYLWRNQGR